MHGEGWRRLWELVKWLASIGVGVACFITLIPKNPLPTESAPSAGQILIGVLIASGIAGGATFGLLSALEWVYRGFRPLPITPTAEGHNTPPVATSGTVPAPEQLPALPNPDSQRKT